MPIFGNAHASSSPAPTASSQRSLVAGTFPVAFNGAELAETVTVSAISVRGTEPHADDQAALSNFSMIEFFDIHRRSFRLLALAILLIQTQAVACIWDSDTLWQERRAHPKIAEAILGSPSPKPDPTQYRTKIQQLLQSRRDDDPEWWNELAGAHLRLGEAEKAVTLLEPVRRKFDGNYGIHANLGTAYHLLGRYADAEREIARDLEINPEAHFGLEKYHLALLQYLSRDTNYQYRHVYIDEFTDSFLRGGFKGIVPTTAPSEHARETNSNARTELEAELHRATNVTREDKMYRRKILWRLAIFDSLPTYQSRWNLAKEPNLEDGLIYMASLNPEQPACFVMLGVKSLRNGDLNLARAAFERAQKLGSLQSDLLQERIDSIQDHIREARMELLPLYGGGVLIVGAIAFYLIQKVRSLRMKNGQKPLRA